MTTYQYLIIGGGMTAAAAINGIREVDPTGSIGLISEELDEPYKRPPLSKSLWKGKPLDIIWKKVTDKTVTLHLGRAATEIVPDQKCVVDSNGDVFSYEKLLLATGGRPRRLPFGGNEIIYFRTVADYRRLRTLTETGQKFAVIGGGFIGSEIAAALTLNGKEVTMIFPESTIGDRIFPRSLAQFVSDAYKEKGIEMLPGEKVAGLEMRGKRHVLKTSSSRKIEVDVVVAGIGIEPNVELARSAGIEMENGIIVDAFLRTNQREIYSAGDVAAFHNPALGKRLRVEHENAANSMGRLAGRNIVGLFEPYEQLPFFYSEMFDLRYEAVGEVDARLEAVEDWRRPHLEGVVYYLQDARVRGVLLWNVWDQVEAARQSIDEPGPFTAENLKGRLPVKGLIED